MRELTQLYLNSNKLTGTIPSQLGDLKQLVQLSFDDNNLTGSVPHSVCELEKIANLAVDCLFTASTPAQIECLCCTNCCNREFCCRFNKQRHLFDMCGSL
mmetsp:Transcript_35091/g.71841  ORF Transcript_35091/g.71841 Transcript_35091/m.71841 type:complete len:100 (-) Transcript_35091:54-353(-)